jgi:hypothetical protein
LATYTATDLANIKAAIAGGVQQAMINGEMVQYRSLGDMIKIQGRIEADIAAGSGTSAPRLAVRYPETDRGI